MRERRRSRPYADFSVPGEILARWRPIHRTVQCALAIVAASDPRMRALAAWPGDRDAELSVLPGLPLASEGGVTIRVAHGHHRSEAFPGSYFLDSARSQTEFRLLSYGAISKSGDDETWHATTFRMAELVDAYAVAFMRAPGRDDRAKARAAGRALSGRDAARYRRWERMLERNFPGADPLRAMLDTRDADSARVA